MPYLKAVVNDDGDTEYVEVPDEEIFTEEAILATSVAKKLVKEAYNKRQSIKTLKQQLAELDADESEDDEPAEASDETPEAVQPETVPEPLDKVALFAEFKQMQAEEARIAREAEQARKTMLETISKEERVPVSILSVVKGSTEEEIRTHAKEIAQSGLVFEDFGANGESVADDDDAGIEALFKDMGLD